jgi:hypothetical protein
MSSNLKIVLSASRRTDIPAFYMPWFMGCIEKQAFTLINPFNRRITRIAVTPATVDTIVFWSKDFGSFLEGGFGRVLQDMGYNLFFNFTVNSRDPLLEPRLPSLQARMDQFGRLGDAFGYAAINWRFDPICHYRHAGKGPRNNLHDFEPLACKLADLGVKRCITSFMDLYPKIAKRLSVPGSPRITFVDPPIKEKVAVLMKMETLLGKLRIDLYTCCEADVLEHLPTSTRIQPSACISNSYLMQLFGGRLSTGRDPGQRRGAGCRCQRSVDIGVYHRHPCRHGCLFCYANPVLGNDDAEVGQP